MDTGKMKLSVVLLLVLPVMSPASPLDIRNNTKQINFSFKNSDGNGSPEIAANRFMRTNQRPLAFSVQKKQVQSSFVSDDGSNLEWVTWNNALPNNTVSIYNDDSDRIDYVCKYKCNAGFYSPSKGPYCHYANATKAYSDSQFDILVNKNNFEVLEWKKDSYGSVPKSSVRTCPGGNIYVGKNKYGLGEVATKDEVFYLPWEGSVYSYKSYQILTINENVINQKVYDVRYNIDESKIFHYPPETIRQTSISNHECHTVVKTDSLSKIHQVEHKWDFTFSVQVGVQMTFTTSIPLIFSDSIQFSSTVTFQYSTGNTVTEAITDTVSVEITAPPNHSCKGNVVQYKFKVDIPFTARLRRTYTNGEIHTTSITGTYNSVRVGEIRAVADRCEPLDNAEPCT